MDLNLWVAIVTYLALLIPVVLLVVPARDAMVEALRWFRRRWYTYIWRRPWRVEVRVDALDPAAWTKDAEGNWPEIPLQLYNRGSLDAALVKLSHPPKTYRGTGIVDPTGRIPAGERRPIPPLTWEDLRKVRVTWVQRNGERWAWAKMPTWPGDPIDDSKLEKATGKAQR